MSLISNEEFAAAMTISVRVHLSTRDGKGFVETFSIQHLETDRLNHEINYHNAKIGEWNRSWRRLGRIRPLLRLIGLKFEELPTLSNLPIPKQFAYFFDARDREHLMQYLDEHFAYSQQLPVFDHDGTGDPLLCTCVRTAFGATRDWRNAMTPAWKLLGQIRERAVHIHEQAAVMEKIADGRDAGPMIELCTTLRAMIGRLEDDVEAWEGVTGQQFYNVSEQE